MYLVAVNLENPREMAVALAKEGRRIRIGRKPESLPEEPVDLLRITWNDRLVSRNHCEAERSGNKVELARLPALTGRSTPNALYTNVAPRNRDLVPEPVSLDFGGSVIIGTKGNTAIYWLKSLSDLDAEMENYRLSLESEKEAFEQEPITEQDYDEVAQLDEYSLRLQLKLLQRELPEQVLSGWSDETDLFTRASVFLENALPGQKGVSATFVALDSQESDLEIEQIDF